MSWCTLLLSLVVLRGPVAPAPTTELVVLLPDANGSAQAVLWLSDRPAVPPSAVEEVEGGLFVQLMAEADGGPAASLQAGRAWGTAEARATLIRRIRPEAGLPEIAAAWVGDQGVASFFGNEADPLRLDPDRRGVVLARGVSVSTVRERARAVRAVQGDPVETLLVVADGARDFWPGGAGPRSALLVARGSDRAPEVVAVAPPARLGPALVERHLRHLAEVEAPRRLALARRACDTGAPTCERRVAAFMAVAWRAAAGLPRDPALQEAIAEAEELRLSLGPPGP